MRKTDQVLENKEIKNKILEGIHFGYYVERIGHNDEDRIEKIARKEKIAIDLLEIMKRYKHCAPNVESLDMSVYDIKGYYTIYLYERFDNFSNRRTRLELKG